MSTAQLGLAPSHRTLRACAPLGTVDGANSSLPWRSDPWVTPPTPGFTQPGIWNAMNNTGAGGLARAELGKRVECPGFWVG
ncbi:hypothetical protein N658DRAFT_326017 [Parathielavia hyrcaniae]|uniref:Uncharacterized protein n=1 Tax=Parathielavia hyrcaniae TaxID=113614 RepID=A0AAN6Q3I0_9PEZI|nr:hypothetical protein N658DRAFT_326017 [Parathielavia hyrcaniae]